MLESGIRVDWDVDNKYLYYSIDWMIDYCKINITWIGLGIKGKDNQSHHSSDYVFSSLSTLSTKLLVEKLNYTTDI